jgi:DNA-binding SARP family transcriptional activator
VLGAVEVRTSDGDVVPLPSRRVTVLLAALGLRVNRTMPVDELVDLLWNEDELPSNPRSALQIYVSRLRATIGDTDRTTIATAPGGYSLRAEPANVDVEVFRELVREATGIADPAARIDTLGRALALWRGRPLAGLDIGTVSRELVPRLDEEHLQAQELYFDARLAAGESTALVPELTELAERHPARERVWAQLISAHRASGRTALALSTYADVADRLRELLGADPGPELQRLHAELLAPTELGVVPRQLPAGVPAFTGRTDDLERRTGHRPGRRRQDLARRPLGPSGSGPVPRRHPVRRPARLLARHGTGGPTRGPVALPGRAGYGA